MHLHLEVLPDDSPHAPLKYAVMDDQLGHMQAAFVHERDAQYWIDMNGEFFDPEARNVVSDMDLLEGQLPF